MLPTDTPVNNSAHYRQNDETPGNQGDESPVMALHNEATSLVRTAIQRRPKSMTALDFAIAVADDTIDRYRNSGHLAEVAHVNQVREQLYARKRHGDPLGKYGPYVDGLPSMPIADEVADELPALLDVPGVDDDLPPHTDAAPSSKIVHFRTVYGSLTRVERIALNVGLFFVGCFAVGFVAAVSSFIAGLVF